MRATEFINESLTGEVFHYTHLRPAIQILKTGKFELSSVAGSIEAEHTPKGYDYFLSTTRTLTGGYHNTIGASAVMFNLDGNYYNQRYKSKPVDYWGDRNNTYGRNSEAEDRIFSKTPTIPAAGITSVHVYMQPMDEKERKNWGSGLPAWARQILILAKTKGIPAYLYNDETAWRRQDPKGHVKIAKDVETLQGAERIGRNSGGGKKWLSPWVELIHATKTSQLNKDAARKRYDLVYSYSKADKNSGNIGNDLSNARKPDSADRGTAKRIFDYMRKNHLQTPGDFAAAMQDKWKAIDQQEQAAKKQEQPR